MKPRATTRRSAQRGTAMMESLIVTIALIPLLAGTVYFQATYSAAIKAGQNTRAYSWTYGLHGCSEVPEDKELAIDEKAGEPGESTDDGDGDLKGELDDTGNTVPGTGTSLDNDTTVQDNVFGTAGFGVGQATASSSVQISAFNSLRIEGKEMGAKTEVQCNLVPEDKINVGPVAVEAAKNIANW